MSETRYPVFVGVVSPAEVDEVMAVLAIARDEARTATTRSGGAETRAITNGAATQ